MLSGFVTLSVLYLVSKILKCVVLSVEKISLVTGGCARSVVASSVSVVVVRAITRIRVVEES